MTAQEFIDKFHTRRHPVPIKLNCMTDMACPECGQRRELAVEVPMYVGLSDDGTDAYSEATEGRGDVEWDRSSRCFCPECYVEGVVQDFNHPGLDELLAQLQEMEGA